jgi:hypothetical protein
MEKILDKINSITSLDEKVEYLYENIMEIKNGIKLYISESNNFLSDNPLIFEEYKSNTTDKKLSFFFCSIIKTEIYKIINSIKEFELYEKDEIDNSKTDRVYQIIVADTEIKIKIFTLFLLFYAFESKIRHKKDNKDLSYLGIDYEFRLRKIALMQMNFERSPKMGPHTNYIWITYPLEFLDHTKSILLSYIMRNKLIYKILHGADSLDLPYMYQEMFGGDKNIILDFTSKVVDTRFLCEYYKLSKDDGKACSIYDALLYFGTISQNKYDSLEKTHEYMGPVQDISWNVHKMSSHHLKYALYDVLFLMHFLFDIYKKAGKDIKCYGLLNTITRFSYLEKREVTDIVKQMKKIVDPMNNYFILANNTKNTLMSIYTNIINTDVFKNININLNILLGVNYFRTQIIYLIKMIVYTVISQNFTIYINKHKKSDEALNIKGIINEISELKFPKLLVLVKESIITIRKEILDKYKK